MIFDGNGSPGVLIRGPNSTDATFTVSVAARAFRSSPESTVSRTIRDTIFSVHKAAETAGEFDISVSGSNPAFYRSLTPGIADVTSDGYVYRVANGPFKILATTRVGSKIGRGTITGSGGAATLTPTGFAPGSLALHCCNEIDSRLALRSGKQIFSGTAYDPTCWASDLPLAGISTSLPRATAITPRHITGAEHYPPGTTVTFRAPDGTEITRTVTASMQIGLPNASDANASDFIVGVLNADLPGTIPFYPILPANWRTKIPGLANGVPIFATNQFLGASVVELSGMADGVGAEWRGRVPASGARLTAFTAVVNLDSSSPRFLIANGGLNLIGTVGTLGVGGSGTGPRADLNIANFNSAIVTLGSNPGDYRVTQADFSGWPDQ